MDKDFLPVEIRCSPEKGKNMNLTGSPRKLKDTAADVFNTLHRWTDLNKDGRNAMNEIANIKLDIILSKEAASEETVSHSNSFPTSLEPLCQQLAEIYKKMEKCVNKLEGFAQIMENLHQLESYRNSKSEETLSPMFLTWHTAHFVEATQEVFKSYKKELSLKKMIIENVCHATDRNTMMFYIAAWIHQPYITDNATLLVESMLTETGHRGC
ncbi:hypothetical protein ACJMK2_037672 [Sinanodonta woodiana]|uniref:Cyclin-dependent kinase 2-interacting protein n=1 Tax=Sinanodonta woodiana TaxID=1069815 RepID=A0ABD3WL59_SINWO